MQASNVKDLWTIGDFMNAQLTPSFNKTLGIHFPDVQPIIEKIKTLVPTAELETLSSSQADEACFNCFLDICFQQSIMAYQEQKQQSFETLTTMIDPDKNMAHFNKSDGDRIVSKAYHRIEVFFQYLKLVMSDPYRDWIGDIFMQMVAQHVSKKDNGKAFYPTPNLLSSAGIQFLFDGSTDEARMKKEPITRIGEICCGTAIISIQALKKMKKEGVLHKAFLWLADLDQRMTKIAATQCLSVMMMEETAFGLQVIQQNVITQETRGVAFSNVGLAVYKNHSLKEEAPWTPARKPTASTTL